MQLLFNNARLDLIGEFDVLRGINLSHFNIKVVAVVAREDENMDIFISNPIDEKVFADFSASIFACSGIFTP